MNTRKLAMFRHVPRRPAWPVTVTWVKRTADRQP